MSAAAERVGVAIVDDDPGFVAALAELASLDPTLALVGTATSVGDALVLLRDERVRLAIVDVNMPDGGGVGIARSIRCWDSAPSVMLVSADPPGAAVLASGASFTSKQDLTLQRIVDAAEEARR